MVHLVGELRECLFELGVEHRQARRMGQFSIEIRRPCCLLLEDATVEDLVLFQIPGLKSLFAQLNQALEGSAIVGLPFVLVLPLCAPKMEKVPQVALTTRLWHDDRRRDVSRVSFAAWIFVR